MRFSKLAQSSLLNTEIVFIQLVDVCKRLSFQARDVGLLNTEMSFIKQRSAGLINNFFGLITCFRFFATVFSLAPEEPRKGVAKRNLCLLNTFFCLLNCVLSYT